jgi:CheY-like chemotaxis protein
LGENQDERRNADISQMPFMSGVEVVRALREMGNPLYVVGCTGNALREDQVRRLSSLSSRPFNREKHRNTLIYRMNT